MLGLLAVGMLWGSTSVLTRIALHGAAPAFLALARVALGAAVLTVALTVRGLRLPRGRDWVHLAVLAVSLAAVPFTLTAWGQRFIPASLASLLHATIPLFTAAAATVLLRRRPRPAQLIGLALGLGGVAVANGFAFGHAGFGSWRGSAALLGSAASYGFGYTYLRRHLAHLQPLQVAAASQLLAALVLLPAADDTIRSSISRLGPGGWAALVLLGVFGTGCAQLLNYRNITRLGPTIASTATCLTAPAGIAAAAAVLDDPLRWRLIAGMALILPALALVQRGRAAARPQAASAPTAA